jgi:hypothetical protein
MESTARERQDQEVLRASLDAVVSANALIEINDLLDGYFVLREALDEAITDRDQRMAAKDALDVVLEGIRARVKAANGNCERTGVALLEVVGQ